MNFEDAVRIFLVLAIVSGVHFGIATTAKTPMGKFAGVIIGVVVGMLAGMYAVMIALMKVKMLSA